MAIFRQFIAPLLIVLTFLFALAAVSARSFLPADMAQPAPIEDVTAPERAALPTEETVAQLPPNLSLLVKGLPDDPILAAPL